LLIGYLFPLLFIVLYTKYKKELVKWCVVVLS
jgi:hypothetical protein